MLRNGCIYKFTCSQECEINYIGESKRLLKIRVNEHSQASRKTAIYKHISTCEHFYNSLNLKLAAYPNAKQAEKDSIRTEHLQSHFKPMAFDNNYFKRTTIEALMISLHEPKLNEQVLHKKTFLL